MLYAIRSKKQRARHDRVLKVVAVSKIGSLWGFPEWAWRGALLFDSSIRHRELRPMATCYTPLPTDACQLSCQI